MDFEVEEVLEPGGARVIAVRGEIDLDTAGDLRRQLEARNGRPAASVIDLSECSFIDSVGVTLLVRAHRRAERNGQRLVIVASPGSQVRRTLRLTNLDSSIPVLESRAAALEFVSAPPLERT